MFARLAVLAALLPAIASATLSISQPDSGGWVGNTTVLCAWSWAATDPNFSIELANPGVTTGLLKNGPIAIANNIQPNVGSTKILLPVVPPADGYTVKFVKIDDINTVYATSTTFAISSNPSGSSVSLSSPTTGSSSGGLTTTTSRLNTTTTGAKKTSGTGTATNTGANTTISEPTVSNSNSQSITTLQISTTSTSTSSTSTKKNAASSKVDVMSWNFASLVALGSALLGSLVVA